MRDPSGGHPKGPFAAVEFQRSDFAQDNTLLDTGGDQ